MGSRRLVLTAVATLIAFAGGLGVSVASEREDSSRRRKAPRAVPVEIVNDAVPVELVRDPNALRRPFVKWIKVDLSEGKSIVQADFLEVPEGFRFVAEYINVDACTLPAVQRMTINLRVQYLDPETGQLRWQSLKVLMTEQGVFDSEEDPGRAYRHFGSSQPMNIYVDPAMKVEAWIYRDAMVTPGHAEASLWISGYLLPAI